MPDLLILSRLFLILVLFATPHIHLSILIPFIFRFFSWLFVVARVSTVCTIRQYWPYHHSECLRLYLHGHLSMKEKVVLRGRCCCQVPSIAGSGATSCRQLFLSCAFLVTCRLAQSSPHSSWAAPAAPAFYFPLHVGVCCASDDIAKITHLLLMSASRDAFFS